MPFRKTFIPSERYGRLTIVEEGLRLRSAAGRMYRNFVCVCDCGNKTVVRAQALTSGSTQSCGCLRQERSLAAHKTHGAWSSPAYKVWTNMLTRCRNTNNPAYKNYGAKGITVCERWHSFENFIEDMGLPSKNMTLDRIDNTLGYFKENCRWATREIQARNTSRNRWVQVNGKTYVLKDAAKQLNISAGAIHYRAAYHGISIQEALDHYINAQRNKEVNRDAG